MRWFWLVLAFIIFVIVIGFALLNFNEVSINLYVTKVSLPLSAALIISFIIGGVFGIFFGFCQKIVNKFKRKKEKS